MLKHSLSRFNTFQHATRQTDKTRCRIVPVDCQKRLIYPTVKRTELNTSAMSNHEWQKRTALGHVSVLFHKCRILN